MHRAFIDQDERLVVARAADHLVSPELFEQLAELIPPLSLRNRNRLQGAV
jgi:hypothetical protein